MSLVLFSAEKSRVEGFSSDEVSKALGAKIKAEFRESPLPHMKITLDGKPGDFYFLFSTTDLKTTTKGLKGPVEVFVLTDSKANVVSIFIGGNKETPQYLQKLSGSDFLKKWNGKKSGDAVPDTVSGATYSSKAVNEGVAKLLSVLQKTNFFKTATAE